MSNPASKSVDKPCGGCTAERLRELLEYDPLTGLFRWHNPTPRQAPGWFKGSHSVRSYRRLYVDGEHILAHVAAWAIQTGKMPDHRIDHDDRDEGNNRWDNLRAATQSQNQMNKGRSSNNTSGYKGVSSLPSGSFRAYITVDGKKRHLGCFPTALMAHHAYCNAAQQFYGEYGNAGR